MGRGNLTEGASYMVAVLVHESTKPESDKQQLRAAAQGMLAGVETDLDRAWLHVVIGRSYGEDQTEQAITSMEAAYELAVAHNLAGPLVNAGGALYVMYLRTEQREKAHAVARELSGRALDGITKKLAATGAAIGQHVGRGLMALGAALSRASTTRGAQDDPDGASAPSSPPNEG